MTLSYWLWCCATPHFSSNDINDLNGKLGGISEGESGRECQGKEIWESIRREPRGRL